MDILGAFVNFMLGMLTLIGAAVVLTLIGAAFVGFWSRRYPVGRLNKRDYPRERADRLHDKMERNGG